MIKIIEVTNASERKKIAETFDPNFETWVVADIQSKSILQNEFLKKHSCLQEDAVLRVSELWQKILVRSQLDIELASGPFISTWLSEWLKIRDLEWAKHPGTAQMLSKYIGALLPILTHQHLIDKTREWLRANTAALLRWGHWFELSVEAWQYLCLQKTISAPWLSSYLSGSIEELKNNKIWPRKIIFDVGADIVGVEVELLKNLLADNEVVVISPELSWRQKYNSSLWPYDLLKNKSLQSTQKSFSLRVPVEKVVCHRFTTQIAEVKAAVSQLRTWLEAGIEPQRIGVLAADIEDYWPALQSYLKIEGLPTQKGHVLSATSMTSLHKWLARLSTETKDIDSGALELSLYSASSRFNLAYDKFQQLFSRIYDEHDLSRDRQIQNTFKFKYGAHDKILRDEFLLWALGFWSGGHEGLEKVIAVLLQECPVGSRLEMRSWLSYLSSLVAKVEIKIDDGHKLGIHCGSFDFGQSIDFDKVILLGLSDRALRTSSEIGIHQNDVEKILADLGVYLDAPDADYYEYLAEHIAHGVSQEAHFYFSATDFSGQAQAPSLLWLQYALANNIDIEKFEVPQSTRWDEIQHACFKNGIRDNIKNFVDEDLGLAEFKAVENISLKRFSASQIEKYLTCPFIFAAEKLFHLSDLPDVDLDVDAMTNGRLIHAVLEKLLEPPINYALSDAKIDFMVDNLRTQMGLYVGDERLWPAKRLQYVRTAKKFLEFEKKWMAQYPQAEVVGREVRISGALQLKEDVSIEISGIIDRVEYVKGTDKNPRYAVVDYKSTAGGLHNYSSWVKNDEIQLAFYSMAIEQGLTTLPKGEVIGAFYYVLANMNREKGIRLKGSEGQLFSANSRNRSGATDEVFAALILEIQQKILSVVEKIKSGHIEPVPKDKKDCIECHWRSACRAPHLN